jgi:hypothetical protein
MSIQLSASILTPVSPGELLDKLSILEIKTERIFDAEKLKNVKIEYDLLAQLSDAHIKKTDNIRGLYKALKDVNELLWVIEDDIRDCERNKDFSDTFIQLARQVYITNDKRALLKKEINQLLGSTIVEEKSYQNY